MSSIIRTLSRKVVSFLGLEPLKQIQNGLKKNTYPAGNIVMQEYLERNLFSNNKYIQSDRIARYSKSIFASSGIDGIIAEIFERIGLTNRFFVEFGAHSYKNNSTLLLTQNWRGVWIEGSSASVNLLKSKLDFLIQEDILTIKNAFITRENIEDLFASLKLPNSFDLLSIDIDGNDYWIWESINNYQPRLVIIEYNASIPSNQKWIMEYNPAHNWDGSSYFGASLKSLELLGKKKGYALIGCDYTGTNAFFVLDKYANKFEGPHTSDYHYESPKYFVNFLQGHPPGFGPFKTH